MNETMNEMSWLSQDVDSVGGFWSAENSLSLHVGQGQRPPAVVHDGEACDPAWKFVRRIG